MLYSKHRCRECVRPSGYAASECIADGARVIDEQQNRIQRLRDCGEDTTKAERVLQYMESVQARYVATKARLQSMLNGLIRH
jgi:hypothetical protein